MPPADESERRAFGYYKPYEIRYDFPWRENEGDQGVKRRYTIRDIAEMAV